MGERCDCDICENAQWDCGYDFRNGDKISIVWEVVGCKKDQKPDVFTGRCDNFELMDEGNI